MKQKILAFTFLSASFFLVSQTCLTKHRLSNHNTQEISEHDLTPFQDIEFQYVTKEQKRGQHLALEVTPVVLIIPPTRLHVTDHAEIHGFFNVAVSLIPARASPLFPATVPGLSC